MISPKQKRVITNSFDTLLSHQLKNFTGRAVLPVNGKQRLFAAVAEYDLLEEARQTKFFLRLLPNWLQSYLLNGNKVKGASESRGYIYSTSYGEATDSLMIKLYGVRILAVYLHRYV